MIESWFNTLIVTMIVILVSLIGLAIYLKRGNSQPDFPPISEENAKMLGEQIKKQIEEQQQQANKPRLPKRKRQDIKVNLVVLGNEKCGKTTFLKKLLGPQKDSDPINETSNKLETVRMRKEHIVIDFIDTSEKKEFREELNQSIFEADFIFIMYDINVPETHTAIGKKWLPLIREVRKRDGSRMPKLAILANKCDDPEYDLPDKDQDLLKNLDKENISFVAVCSSVSGRNVDQAFEIAHQISMNPLDPLVNLEKKTLTQKFINALDEIFTYFDKDADGILSDDEMQHLSMIVWNEELKNDTLLNIKDVLFKEEPLSILKEGTTLIGFQGLMHKYIKNGRRDIPWDMIRDYGFDNKLNKTGICHFLVEEKSLAERKEKALEQAAELASATDSPSSSVTPETSPMNSVERKDI